MIDNIKNISLSIFIPLVMMLSCNQNQKSDKNQVITRDSFIEINKKLVENDSKIIREYVATNNLGLKETQTGLWMKIDNKGSGIKAEKGLWATVGYKVSLLDGTVCYSSDIKGVKNFKIGQGGVESGLEEGILLMREGDEATFIMPPHLAHGLIGDDAKIGMRSIIIYQVQLKKIDYKASN